MELVTSDEGVEVTTDRGTVIAARSMLLTVGIGSFSPKPLPAAADWTGGGVVHFVPQPAELAGHDVVIVGGGDSAIDWAHMLYPVAKSVRVVHRRDRFRAAPAMLERVRSMGIPFHVPAQVTRLIGNGRLAAVELTPGRRHGVGTAVRHRVAALGFHADIGPLITWGVELSGRHIVVDSTGATNLPRIYAAGDIVTYPGKVALLATGFGEVATATTTSPTCSTLGHRVPRAHVGDGLTALPQCFRFYRRDGYNGSGSVSGQIVRSLAPSDRASSASAGSSPVRSAMSANRARRVSSRDRLEAMPQVSSCVEHVLEHPAERAQQPPGGDVRRGAGEHGVVGRGRAAARQLGAIGGGQLVGEPVGDDVAAPAGGERESADTARRSARGRTG